MNDVNKAQFLELDEVKLTEIIKSSKVGEEVKVVSLRVKSLSLKNLIKVSHGRSD